MKKNSISACIIAYNNIQKIAAAIRSVSWCDEIIVVDSYSTDGTTELAEQLGARVVQVPFLGFGDLRNQAAAACRYEWILSIDTDEYCPSELREEILSIVHSAQSLDIYHIPRKSYFMGHWIKHSGWDPDYRQPQLFRRDSLTYKLDLVHEGYISHTQKPIGYLKNRMLQMPFENVSEMLRKADRYSTLEVGQRQLKKKYKKKVSVTKVIFHSLWTFIKHYFLKKGFLDGLPGFVIAVGYGHGAFCRYVKLYESQRQAKESDLPWFES